jgi:hypothetical protein
MLANATRWRGAIISAKIDDPNFARFGKKLSPNWKSILHAFANQRIEKSRAFHESRARKIRLDFARSGNHCGGAVEIAVSLQLASVHSHQLGKHATILPDDWRNSSSPGGTCQAFRCVNHGDGIHKH